MSIKREELCSLWPMLDRPMKLLERWECPRGIIFESDPASSFEAVINVSALLGGHVEKFERHPVLKEDWHDRAGSLIRGEVPRSALFEARKDKLCIIVLDLDNQPEWLQLALKAPMDRSNPPLMSLCILATADDARKIPDYVRSHFHVVRKTGVRRGPRKSSEKSL